MTSFHLARARFALIALLLCCTILLAAAPCAQAAPTKAPPHKARPAKQRVKPGSLPPLAPTAVVPLAPVAQAGDVMLYDGQAPDQSNVALSAWGGGTAEDNGTVSFSKGHSLKITTLGPYQGGKVTLQSPADLGDLSDPQRVLVFMLRLTPDTRRFSRTDIPAHPLQPQLILAQFPQNAPPGALPPPGAFPGYPGGPGFSPNSPAAPLPPQALSSIHFIFTRVGGTQADVLRPYPDLSQTAGGAGAEQWVPVAVPLAALHFPTGTPASPLQSIVVAGNDYAVFYLGQIRLTRDTAPITCFAGADQTVSTGEPVTLRGNADGGVSSLHYAWDFDSADGITEQAEGPVVTTGFLKAKDYAVTLTVSDIDGLKKPAVSTVTIHVQQ